MKSVRFCDTASGGSEAEDRINRAMMPPPPALDEREARAARRACVDQGWREAFLFAGSLAFCVNSCRPRCWSCRARSGRDQDDEVHWSTSQSESRSLRWQPGRGGTMRGPVMQPIREARSASSASSRIRSGLPRGGRRRRRRSISAFMRWIGFSIRTYWNRAGRRGGSKPVPPASAVLDRDAGHARLRTKRASVGRRVRVVGLAGPTTVCRAPWCRLGGVVAAPWWGESSRRGSG